jgi:hypothetical protein
VSDSYFVVSSDEDGGRIEKIDEQELLKRFNVSDPEDLYYGEGKVPTIPTGDRFDLRSDYNFFIIKGDFVELKPREVVREWEIA